MLALRLLSEDGKGLDTSLVWLLYIGIVVFFQMIIIGRWTSSKKQDQFEVQYEAEKPAKKDSDDLVRIEGIGPNANEIDVQKILNGAGLQMMNPEGWIAQAKLAAKGDWQAFEKLQAELKGGRKAR